MRSNEQLVQEALLAQLSEYQQQQLDEFDIAEAPANGGSKIMKGLRGLGRSIGALGDLKSKVQGYDVAKGTALQQRAIANNLSVAQQKQKEKAEKDAAKAADTTQAAQPAASKRTGGKVAGQLSQTPSAIARRKKTAADRAVKAGLSVSDPTKQKSGIRQGISKVTPTSVPGQSSKTAKTVAAKTSVKKPPQKQPTIGGVKPNDPTYAALARAVAAAEKKQAQA